MSTKSSEVGGITAILVGAGANPIVLTVAGPSEAHFSMLSKVFISGLPLVGAAGAGAGLTSTSGTALLCAMKVTVDFGKGLPS